MRIISVLFINFLLCACAFSYELKVVSEVSPVSFLKWNLSNGPVPIYLDRRGSSDLSLANVEQALVAALDSWQSVSSQNLRFQYEGAISLPNNSNNDQRNSVQWVESGWTYSSHALAVTSYSYYLDDPPSIIDADIYMNGEDYKWSVGPIQANKIDVQQTLIHEIGHLIGFGHTGVAVAQMFPYLSGEQNHKITRDDKAALRYLYGVTSPAFGLLTPIRRARYASNLSSNGLPLPVFRWNEGQLDTYTIEFSNSATFEKKIQVSSGPFPFYEMTASLERRLKNLSADGRIFWRVRSGSVITSARSLRFLK